MIFEELNLNKPLLKALADLEFEYLTPIQEKAFSVIMSGRNVVGIAQTGTGKTFAYLMPVLRQLSYSEQRDPRVLILVPTRELVIQVVSEINKLNKYSNFRVAGIYGGTNINTQKQLIYDGLDIIVATPSRVLDLNLTGVLRLNSISKLIIDEVDQLLNLGFRPQMITLMERLPEKRQNLLFSATLTPIVQELINEYFINPATIEIAAHGTPIEKIEQLAYKVPNYNTKVNLLEYILKDENNLNKVLVFVNTKKTANSLFEHILQKFPDQVGIIHSNKSQNFRVNVLQLFTEGALRILITTDIIARGLDICDVSHVINFELSEEPADYIHRIGRTGRIDKEGISISFISGKDHQTMSEIENLMNKKIDTLKLPSEVQISNVFLEEERPAKIVNIDRKKENSSREIVNSAYHEKKEKNKKVNLGGPKIRNPKHGKPKHKSTKPQRPRF